MPPFVLLVLLSRLPRRCRALHVHILFMLRLLQPNGAKILWENDTLAIFRPRDPCAEKHYLVVPKRHIQNVKSLRYEDEALVRGMGEAASRFLDALTDGTPSLSTRRFVFHVPPSNSIDHLHLHAFEGSFYKWFMRRVVYSPGTNPWCETLAKTLATRFKPPPSAL